MWCGQNVRCVFSWGNLLSVVVVSIIAQDKQQSKDKHKTRLRQKEDKHHVGACLVC
jgi:hypothetical protein